MSVWASRLLNPHIDDAVRVQSGEGFSVFQQTSAVET